VAADVASVNSDAPPSDRVTAVDTASVDVTVPDTAPSAEEVAFGCPADPELRLCLTFDDVGTGTRLTDHSGRGNHGFLNTARLVGGVSGSALGFSVGTQHARIPDAESLRLTGAESTFEAWIRPTMSPVDAGADIIIGKVDLDYGGWALALYGAEVRLYVSGVTQRGAPGIRFGFWNHVAIVLAPGGVLIYVNGKEAAPLQPPLPIPLKTGLVTIGNTNPAVMNDVNRSGYFGDVDVIRLYGRAKRPAEICADADGSWTAGACRPRTAAPRN
jgi:hypothetical protein